MGFERGNKYGKKFSKENQPSQNGRKPKLKGIPSDARERVYSALYHALTLPDAQTAAAYLAREAQDLPECGYLIQIYSKGMMGKNAIAYVSDIMDRIFGKPRQTTDVNVMETTQDRPEINIE